VLTRAATYPASRRSPPLLQERFFKKANGRILLLEILSLPQFLTVDVTHCFVQVYLTSSGMWKKTKTNSSERDRNRRTAVPHTVFKESPRFIRFSVFNRASFNCHVSPAKIHIFALKIYQLCPWLDFDKFTGLHGWMISISSFLICSLWTCLNFLRDCNNFLLSKVKPLDFTIIYVWEKLLTRALCDIFVSRIFAQKKLWGVKVSL